MSLLHEIIYSLNETTMSPTISKKDSGKYTMPGGDITVKHTPNTKADNRDFYIWFNTEDSIKIGHLKIEHLGWIQSVLRIYGADMADGFLVNSKVVNNGTEETFTFQQKMH